MIEDWYYDSGEPYYIATIAQWTESRQPSWNCRIYEKDYAEIVNEWLRENTQTAECTYRFNSGSPCYFIRIYDKDEAVAFQLRWC